MLFGQIKDLLADNVLEFTTSTDDGSTEYKLDLRKYTGSQKLMDAIDGIDVTEPLNGYEVLGIYSIENGFAVDLKLDARVLDAFTNIAEKNKLSYSITKYNR